MGDVIRELGGICRLLFEAHPTSAGLNGQNYVAMQELKTGDHPAMLYPRAPGCLFPHGTPRYRPRRPARRGLQRIRQLGHRARLRLLSGLEPLFMQRLFETPAAWAGKANLGCADAANHQRTSVWPAIARRSAEIKERRAIFTANAKANADTPTNNP
jgi:hypothetical protein